jgi:aspartate kinase
VQKFGGTSVSTEARRAQVVAHVRRARNEGFQVAIVVSAMGRRGDPYATDTLLDLLRTTRAPIAPADYDLLFACGEIISAAVMAHTLRQSGIAAMPLTAVQAGIITDGHHVEAEVVRVDTCRLRQLMAGGTVPVVAGGQGIAPGTQDFTTLGRGGSDTSGVALGVALAAERVDIFTDVDRVAVTDPRLVPAAQSLDSLSYASMYEMARYGAKVVHPRALLTAWKAQTPVMVRSTFTETPGTLIGDLDDPAPLVGLATLPPMGTLALPSASVTATLREQWERKHLLMTIVDGASGDVLVGAGHDKQADLREAVEALGDVRTTSHGESCWVSLIGEPSEVASRREPALALLRREGVVVRGWEACGRRCTVVVPETERARVVGLLHDAMFAA